MLASEQTAPDATKRNELPRLSTTPHPVRRKPGSMPMIRIASAMAPNISMMARFTSEAVQAEQRAGSVACEGGFQQVDLVRDRIELEDRLQPHIVAINLPVHPAHALLKTQ